MTEDDSFFNIPEDAREFVEGERRRLEGSYLVVGMLDFTVVTRRVDYGDRSSFESLPGAIKS